MSPPDQAAAAAASSSGRKPSRVEAEAPTVPSRGRNGLRTPATYAMITLGICVLLPYAVPGLERLRLLSPIPPGEALSLAPPPEKKKAVVGEIVLPPLDTPDREQLAQPESVPLPPEADEVVGPIVEHEKPPVSIVDPSGRALDAFYHALHRVELDREGAIARVSAWGDSNVASDLVTSVFRRALQERFGDGGHGFVLLSRPSFRYFHNDVRQVAAAGWRVSRITGPLAADRLYGLGGTSFRAQSAGVFAEIATAEDGSFGRAASRIAVDYLAQPQGDAFEVRIDGQSHRIVSTASDETRSKVASFDVEDGPHRLRLVARGDRLRIFGVWLERDGPGVVVDALGVTNCKVRYLRRIDERHLARQMKLRDPHLLVFNFGINEAREGKALFGGLDAYRRTMHEAIARMRRAAPGVSCLLVAPNDIAYSVGGTKLSYDLLPQLVAIQREIAGELGCAFWNMRAAMGGNGSMPRWVDTRLGEPDMLHPTKAGAQLLGRWLYLALMERYADYKRRGAPDPQN